MNQIKQKTKEKKWIVKSTDGKESSSAVASITDSLGINPIVARLLYNRGYKDPASAKSFLYMEAEVISDPFSMKDMDRAVARIERAVKNKEKITVYGDYDVDGVTSVCTLYLYLHSLGADIDYYIPNRVGEGYGVSDGAIKALAERGTKLIITVDTGITAIEEVKYAKGLGVDFVVTDHHECRQDMPEAEAVVNPHRPDCTSGFKDLAGVGVVFKLICAYETARTGNGMVDVVLSMFAKYADLVAIGTIADVMPIKGENRLIVNYGLKMMENTERTGIAALIDAASNKNEAKRMGIKKKPVKVTSGYIGYTLAPRINAAGRIRSASIAVELFLADTYDKAYEIAEELCLANKERQNEENNIMAAAYKKIEEYGYDKMPVIVLDSDDWHHGVIGIVSSRITEKYGKPSILVSFEGNMNGAPSPDDVGKGSGRSIKGMNLVDALCHCEGELVKFGGHELAAGLSVTRGKLDDFRNKINDYARNTLSEDDFVPTLEADARIDVSDVTLELAEQLGILEPYGVGNPVPSFVMRSATVCEISSVSGGKHTRITFSTGRGTLTGMFFSASPESLGVYVGDKIDVLFNIDINEWAGRKCVQIIIRDIKGNRNAEYQLEAYRERFDSIWSGARFSTADNVIPARDDFAAVYRMIVASVRSGDDTLSVRDIIYKLQQSRDQNTPIEYIKVRVIIKVMQELNIIGIEEINPEKFKFRMYSKTTKTELEKSNLLRRLRSQQFSE